MSAGSWAEPMFAQQSTAPLVGDPRVFGPSWFGLNTRGPACLDNLVNGKRAPPRAGVQECSYIRLYVQNATLATRAAPVPGAAFVAKNWQ